MVMKDEHMTKVILTRAFRWFIILVLLLLPLAGLTKPALAATQPTVPNLDIVLVIDESGSMWAKSDPPNDLNQGWRIVMAKLFADLLGVDQSGSTHQLSVIVFGSKAELVQHLTPIQNDLDRSNLKDAIDTAHQLILPDGTNIPDAISQAYQELDTNGRPDALKVIVFLSDGKCELQYATDTANCNNNIRTIISNHSPKYPIYTIAFTQEAYSGGDSAIYENLWQEIAAETGGEYFKPNKANTDLLDVYIQIIRHLFNLTTENVPAPVQSPSKQAFIVPPGQMQVVFTVVKYDKNINTTVIRPSGATVQASDSDVKLSSSPQTDSFSILKPEAGTWTVQLEGNGSVTVIYIPFPTEFLKVVRQVPSGLAFPAGKPMDFRVQVIDAQNNPQSVEGLKADVTLPDGTVNTLPFTSSDNTTYVAQMEDTTQIGSYALHFTGSQADNKVDDLQSIDVVKAPWIKILEPLPGTTYPFNAPLTVNAQLMFGTDPVMNPDPADKISVLAQLLNGNQNLVDNMLLKPEAGGTFSRQLDANGTGTYQLTTTLAYIKKTGEAFQDVTWVTVNVGNGAAPATPAPTSAPTPIPISSATPAPSCPPDCQTQPLGPIIAIVGGIVLIVGLGGVGWWWFSKPSLIGALETGEMQVPKPLAGKRSIYFGSDPKCAINIQGEGILPKHAELRPIGTRKVSKVEIRSVDPTKPIHINGIETTFQTLHDKDKIRIGDQEYTYSGPPEMEDLGMDNPFPVDNPPDTKDEWKF